MWQKNWTFLKERLNLSNSLDSQDILKNLIYTQREIRNYCQVFKQERCLKELDRSSVFDIDTIMFSDYGFNIDWEDVKLEIEIFIKNEPKTLIDLIGKIYRFTFNLFIYKSQIECPNCRQTELRIYKSDESNIYYECELCLSVYDSNLALYKHKIKLYPCDLTILESKKLLRQ